MSEDLDKNKNRSTVLFILLICISHIIVYSIGLIHGKTANDLNDYIGIYATIIFMFILAIGFSLTFRNSKSKKSLSTEDLNK